MPEKLFKHIRYLSLDVVFGALSGGIFAMKLFNVRMITAWWFILALSVWLIYNADHLLDTLQIKEKVSFGRRLFYKKNYKKLLVTTLLLSIVTIYLSLKFLPLSVILAGIILGLSVVVYLVLIQFFGTKKSLWLQKELIVAAIYSTGIFLVPFLSAYPNINIRQILIFFSYFLIVWADILLIALFEYAMDLKNGFSSLPIILGYNRTIFLMQILLFTAFLVLSFTNIYYPPNKVYLISSIILFVIGFIQLIINNKKDYFKKNERYRIITEFIFFLPALTIFI